MDPLVERTLGPYTLLERLGAGGMGAVYRARHRSLGVTRAVKVLSLPPQLAGNRDAVQLFQREARIAARLEHPHIVRIFDIAEQDGIQYIVMELLQGQSLAQLIQSSRPLPLDRALRILEQIAAALDFAHHQRIVHRDLKPANIFVGPGDRVTILDFGLARAIDDSRLAITGYGIGTPHYMAPEMIDGSAEQAENAHRAGVGIDLYALGVTAFETLAGVPPFHGLPTRQVLLAHLTQTPTSLRTHRPDLPAAIIERVDRQLAKEPSERYLRAGAFVHALSDPEKDTQNRGRHPLTVDDVDVVIAWDYPHHPPPPESLPVSVAFAAWNNLRSCFPD